MQNTGVAHSRRYKLICFSSNYEQEIILPQELWLIKTFSIQIITAFFISFSYLFLFVFFVFFLFFFFFWFFKSILNLKNVLQIRNRDNILIFGSLLVYFICTFKKITFYLLNHSFCLIWRRKYLEGSEATIKWYWGVDLKDEILILNCTE